MLELLELCGINVIIIKITMINNAKGSNRESKQNEHAHGYGKQKEALRKNQKKFAK